MIQRLVDMVQPSQDEDVSFVNWPPGYYSPLCLLDEPVNILFYLSLKRECF